MKGEFPAGTHSCAFANILFLVLTNSMIIFSRRPDCNITEHAGCSVQASKLGQLWESNSNSRRWC
eukprot:511250-Pelagomonas_calceolata.AAC.1